MIGSVQFSNSLTKFYYIENQIKSKSTSYIGAKIIENIYTVENVHLSTFSQRLYSSQKFSLILTKPTNMLKYIAFVCNLCMYNFNRDFNTKIHEFISHNNHNVIFILLSNGSKFCVGYIFHNYTFQRAFYTYKYCNGLSYL